MFDIGLVDYSLNTEIWFSVKIIEPILPKRSKLGWNIQNK